MWQRAKSVLKACRGYGKLDRRFRNWQPVGPLSRSCGQVPNGNGMVYQLNTTTLEIGQQLSPLKGMFALMCLVMFVGGGWMGIGLWQTLAEGLPTDSPTDVQVAYFLMFIAAPILLLSSLFCLVIFINAFFGYTDAPIRFDRYHRKVWAFKPGIPGGVMTFDWDKLTAVTQSVIASPANPANLIRSVLLVELDEQGEVRFENGLPRLITIGPQTGGNTPPLGHYEYVRRFMEDGPQALPPCDDYLEPRVNFRFLVNVFGLLDYSREKAEYFSTTAWLYITAIGVLFTWLMLPFNLVGWLAYRVNRVPRWPQAIAQLAVRGGPLQPPPGARSIVRPVSRREWPVVALWLLSTAWIYKFWVQLIMRAH